ncbi:MAG: hypothetical protein LH473_14165, partial [Chitinophagales bacterium]|nr:hypothetical protein [Chitinophagales bacterium]
MKYLPLKFQELSFSTFYKKRIGACLFFTSLLILFSFPKIVLSQTVTNLTRFYRSGQVFLTWNNISNSTALYKVYRSTTKIETSGQLTTAEYLGYVNYHSSFDHNLTNADGVVKYQRIDSAGLPLNSSTGLFVATTLANGNYYYAVTTLINAVENITIAPGINSMSNAISETVAPPMPVFQENRVDNKGKTFSIYSTFI